VSGALDPLKLEDEMKRSLRRRSWRREEEEEEEATILLELLFTHV